MSWMRRLMNGSLRTPSSTSIRPSVSTANSLEALDYARNLHAEILESNRDLYTRAQVVLTLDGLIVGVVGSRVLSEPGDLRRVAEVFSTLTWLLLVSSVVAILMSLIFATISLMSLHRKGPRVAPSASPWPSERLWYYGHIAAMPADVFVGRASTATAEWEIRARLTQAAIMAPLMVRRANWLNRSFAATTLSFVSLALTATDYVARLV